MAETLKRRVDQLDEKWGRIWRWSLIASVVFHVLLLLLFWATPPLPVVYESAAGARAGDPNAAAGGGMEVIAVVERTAQQPPTPEPEAEVPEEVVVPDPIPVPAPQVTEIPPPRVDVSPPITRSEGTANSPGEGRGQEQGPGTETGTGQGDGGTGEEGLNRIIAPSPRGLILPPADKPGDVRGKTVTVYVFVTERGRVVADSTRLSPSTGDSGFDRRLKEQAAEWQFRPGMRAGTAIAAWFRYTITL